VQIKPEDDLRVDEIPDKNVLGVTASELVGFKSARVMADGFATFINPLSPGLHILTFRAFSPTYSLESQIQLNVRGPSKKPTPPTG